MTSTVIAGRRLSLRLLERGDAELIQQFYRRLSSETIYRRFLSPITLPNDALVKRLVDIDHRDRDALIALDERGIAGIARYGMDPSANTPGSLRTHGAASEFAGRNHEVAVVVADDWQGRGLGSLLLRRLAHIARLRGIASFHATMLGDNRRAQALVLGLSPRTSLHFEAGYLEADIPLRPTG